MVEWAERDQPATTTATVITVIIIIIINTIMIIIFPIFPSVYGMERGDTSCQSCCLRALPVSKWYPPSLCLQLCNGSTLTLLSSSELTVQIVRSNVNGALCLWGEGRGKRYLFGFGLLLALSFSRPVWEYQSFPPITSRLHARDGAREDEMFPFCAVQNQ